LPGRLIEIIRRIGKPTVLVIGDLILDKYVWGRVDRVSQEAPIQVLDVIAEEEQVRPGGAGCVMLNLRHLGAKVLCCGVVGADANARLLRDALRGAGAAVSAVFTDRHRPTPVKTRYLGYVQSAHRAEQHLLRVDHEKRQPIPARIERRIRQYVTKVIRRCDCVLLADYNKGLLGRSLIRAIVSRARRHGVPVIVDPKRDDFSIYAGATAITPNRFETQIASGIAVEDEKSAAAAARKLAKEHGFEHVIITLDKDGMYVYSGRGAGTMLTTVPTDVTDVTGAGDMVISAIGLAVAGGFDYDDAARLANVAAGIEVRKMGVAPVSRREIIRELHIQLKRQTDKILHRDEIEDILKTCRQRGEKIVFTNGCFDLLHAGHVSYLQFARSQGDVLVLGLNSDKSVRKIKDSGRPILAESERARILAGLESVDYIVLFDEPTPINLIRRVKPDVLVKGEDWRHKGVVGREFVESYGGAVVLAPLVPGESTTDIIRRVLDRYGVKKKGKGQ